MNPSATCSGCKFFCETKGGQGECRRHAPTMHLLPMVNPLTLKPFIECSSGWPRCLASQWCGEFDQDYDRFADQAKAILPQKLQ